MNILVIGLPALVLLLSTNFASAAIYNGLIQVVIFLITANIPALLTQRMSYVDIAWPWGLMAIGLFPLGLKTELNLRTKLVMGAYFLAGFRMAFGGAILLFKGQFGKEFPRYEYIKEKIWAQKLGITQAQTWAFNYIMQKEIFVQCVCNMGALCLPLMIQGFGYMPADQGLTGLEIFGWALWASSLVFEHTADKQKKRFVQECAKTGQKKAICNVGLWAYSRHPNYFGEWMVWNSLILTSVPSLLALWASEQENLAVKLGLTWGLFMISKMMYTCLVYYTGAVPAEHFSVQKRPEYAKYQQQVNMFFPWFPKSKNQ